MTKRQNDILDNIKLTLSRTLPKGGSAMLYGSRARGDAHKGSDWDVLELEKADKFFSKLIKMRKMFVMMVMAIITTTTVTAHQLTPEEALSRMKQSLAMSKSIASAPTKECSYTLAYTSVKGDTATYYAFNRTGGGGFVVLSADDCMPAVLMESDEGGSFNADSVPDGMRWWLEQYDKAVCRYAAEGKSLTELSAYNEITPLLKTGDKKTAWGQNAPYNILCPEKAPTGCVMTAMAQIMRYHEYPKVGKGKKKYSFKYSYLEDGKTIYKSMEDSTDFSAHEYRWSDMLDTYTITNNVPNYTEQQASAAATLMHDCGVAAGAEYGEKGTAGISKDAICGMVDYLGYDASAFFMFRCFYTNEQWEQKIYNELQEGRPVLYRADDSKYGGHAFVCDGYKDGRYHMNWGWNGSRNCYVLLVRSGGERAITPIKENETQTGFVFNVNQGACFNIMPDKGGVLNPDVKIGVVSEECPTWTNESLTTTFSRSQELILLATFTKLCYRDRVYTLGVKLSNEDKTYYLTDTNAEEYIEMDEIMVELTDVDDGVYTVTPIYKDVTAGDTEWHDMLFTTDYVAPEITVNGDQPSSVETITSDSGSESAHGVIKTLKDGHVVIKNGNKVYWVTGTGMKRTQN